MESFKRDQHVFLTPEPCPLIDSSGLPGPKRAKGASKINMEDLKGKKVKKSPKITTIFYIKVKTPKIEFVISSRPS